MLQNENLMPKYIEPIYDDGNIIIRQDAEWPIPAFYIVSINNHIGSFDQLDEVTRYKITNAIYFVRKGIRENFGIERAQIYHEEKISSPHFHVWILPLWEDQMQKIGIQPKIYESNVKKYIDSFSFNETKNKILECNKKMKLFLKKELQNNE